MSKIKIFLSQPLVAPFFPPVCGPFKIFGGLAARWIARRAARIAKAAGFDGVELFCVDANYLQEMVDIVKARDLSARTHQLWSFVGGQNHWYNHVFRWLGMLRAEDMPLQKQAVLGVPLIVYADKWREVLDSHSGVQNFLIQTCTEHLQRKFRLSWTEFLKIQEEYRFPIAFDTQHVLEWMNGKIGVSRLQKGGDFLLTRLKYAWDILGQDVVEIHWNDCVLGGDDTRDRNVYPGVGGLPLEKFAQYVRASGWEGVVVPEVSPLHLPRGGTHVEKLAALRREVREYFPE